MKNYKVFFDTNTLRNKDLNKFFGSEDKLKELSSKVEILIPQMVIYEIEAQKRREFNKEVNKLTENKVFQKLSEEVKKQVIFNIDEKIIELKEKIDFEYEIVNLDNKNIIDTLVELAVNKKPPFENKENTDKGFKDAHIYMTILQYLKNDTKSDKVLCCTEDSMLIEALKSLEVKTCILDDIEKNILNPYQTKNFIEKLKAILKYEFDNGKVHIDSDNIEFMYSNYAENDIVSVKLEDKGIYLFEIVDDKINDYIPKLSKDILIDTMYNKSVEKMTPAEFKRIESKVNFLSNIELIKFKEISDDLSMMLKNNEFDKIVEQLSSYNIYKNAVSELKSQIFESENKFIKKENFYSMYSDYFKNSIEESSRNMKTQLVEFNFRNINE